MISNGAVKARKQRRLLSPSQKYKLYVAVLTGQLASRSSQVHHKTKAHRRARIAQTPPPGPRALAMIAAPFWNLIERETRPWWDQDSNLT